MTADENYFDCEIIKVNMIIQKTLEFTLKGRSIVDITNEVAVVVESSGCIQGICNLFIQHTSASLIISENADPQVRKDLEKFMTRLVPDGDPIFEHTTEGEDDMPAHVRTILTQSSISIPIINRRLGLGAWQGIYLWEHRQEAFKRRVIVTIQG